MDTKIRRQKTGNKDHVVKNAAKAAVTKPPGITDKPPGPRSSGGNKPKPGDGNGNGGHGSAPEILANLAVQLLRLKPEQIKIPLATGKALSDPLLDGHFLDALKRADSVLKTAAGLSDDDVHAYQLFDEGSGPMTFDAIKDRFEEVGWTRPDSRSKVEEFIKELLKEANTRIESRLEGYERQLSERRGQLVSLDRIKSNLSRHIAAMIRRSGLRDLVPDGWLVGERVAEVFLHLISRDVPPDNKESPFEQFESQRGYSTFLKYVCDGLGFEKFMGESHHHVRLGLDRLGACVLFFEEFAAAEKIPSDASEDLEKLMRLIYGSGGIPPETVVAMEQCQRDLKAEPRDPEAVKQSAREAVRLLALTSEAWYLKRLENVQHFPGLTYWLEQFREQGLPEVGEMVTRLGALLKSDPTSAEPGELRIRLTGIRDHAQSLRQAIQPPAEGQTAVSNLTALLETVTDNLTKGLQPQPLEKRAAKQKLHDLLEDLSPHTGSRRIRPYELYVFAFQQGLLQDKLVDKLSRLKRGVIPNPPRVSRLSILWAHEGAMLRSESEISTAT
jgi:hypothetical protein